MTTHSAVHQVTQQVNCSDVREGATWHLIPVPEDRVLKIVIDLPPDGKFDFGVPGYDNGTIISLETLKKSWCGELRRANAWNRHRIKIRHRLF